MDREITFKASEGINIVQFNNNIYYLKNGELEIAQDINNVKKNMSILCNVVQEMYLKSPNYGKGGNDLRYGDYEQLLRMFCEKPYEEGLFNGLEYSTTWSKDGASEEVAVADGTADVDGGLDDVPPSTPKKSGLDNVPTSTPKKKKKKKKSAL